MYHIKQTIVLLFIFSLTVGCGGSPASKSSSAILTKSLEYDPIEIPSEIAEDEISLRQRELSLLPLGHPDRIALRDKIAKTLADNFANKKDTDVEERLSIFEDALALHDPSDFKPGGVATEVAPIADWIVKTYSQRGDEALVLAGLRFLMLAKPNDTAISEKYLELTGWSESVRKTSTSPLERISSLIDLYSRMVRLVPDRKVIDHLADMYVERYRLIASAFKNHSMDDSYKRHPLEILVKGRTVQTLPIDLLYIYFLAGDPAGARSHLEEFVDEGVIRVELIELLDRLFQGRDLADSYYTLATQLAAVDARASLRACISARAADPKDPRFPLCIGRSFEELDHPECAFESYVEAAKIAPDEDVFTEVLELLRRALIKVHLKELPKFSKRAIELGETLLDKALGLNPDKGSDLRMIAASLLYTMGEVEFDDGRVESTRRHLVRSFEVMANLPSLIKLTEVYYLLGEFEIGIETLNRESDKELEGQRPSAFWQATILEKRGDLTQALGRGQEAQNYYRDALRIWDSQEIPAEQSTTAAMRRGVILHRLGDFSDSQDAFRTAVRLDPDKQGTYAQLISFLAMEGRLEDAKEFYRLAYNQDQIDDMWKIYYSLWVEGLSKRAGKGSFDLAKGYLENSRGDTWQDKLARFFSGAITIEALRSEAANTGQQVEVDYYGAVAALADGRTAEAHALLNKVIDSNLLGFFEFRMARAILQNELKTPSEKK
jgi:tetratricopeptide (TPR) repeat protein